MHVVIAVERESEREKEATKWGRIDGPSPQYFAASANNSDLDSTRSRLVQRKTQTEKQKKRHSSGEGWETATEGRDYHGDKAVPLDNAQGEEKARESHLEKIDLVAEKLKSRRCRPSPFVD